MKSKEELSVLKEEVENLNKKLSELTDEELAQVSGGAGQIDFLLQMLTEDRLINRLPGNSDM